MIFHSSGSHLPFQAQETAITETQRHVLMRAETGASLDSSISDLPELKVIEWNVYLQCDWWKRWVTKDEMEEERERIEEEGEGEGSKWKKARVGWRWRRRGGRESRRRKGGNEEKRKVNKVSFGGGRGGESRGRGGRDMEEEEELKGEEERRESRIEWIIKEGKSKR